MGIEDDDRPEGRADAVNGSGVPAEVPAGERPATGGAAAGEPTNSGAAPMPQDGSVAMAPPGWPGPAYAPQAAPPGGIHPGQSPYPPYPPGQPYPGMQQVSRLPPLPSRTHRWGLGAYIGVWAVFLGTSLLLALLLKQLVGVQTAGTIALALAVPTVVAAGLAIVITMVRGNGPVIDLGLRWSWRDVGLGLAFGFGGLLVSIPVSVAYVSIVGTDTNSAVGQVFGEVRAGPLMATVVLLIVVLLAPLCEEIVYRGLLWGGIERLGVNRWVTLAVTTVLFAIAHFEWERTPVLLIVAIPLGLARIFTGRLLASIVAHQVNNLLPGIVLMLGLLGVIPMT